MGIQSFLKAERGDPDWAFTPEHYYDKEFKIVGSSLLDIEENSREKMLLRQTPTERELLAKHVKIDVHENSILDLTVINEASQKLQQVFIYDIYLRPGATLNAGLFVKGGNLNKHIIEVTLDTAATFSCHGYAINSVAGDSEIIIKIDHVGDYSTSYQNIFCEAGANSQTVFQSMVNVDESIKNVYASSDIRNLTVGEDSKCHSMPEVFSKSATSKISSITTTNYLDKEKIYYLQTRGMSKIEAETLLINKHRDNILSLIYTNDADLQQEIKEWLE